MRKLYALFTGLILTLFATRSEALPVTPDVANFTFTINHATRLVVFTNTSTLGSEPGPRVAFWAFGDGTGTFTGPLQGTQHQYQHPGTYNVCLKIYRYRSATSDSVLTAMICKTLVINTECRADFEKLPISAANNPLLVSYRALPWHNNGAKPMKICWTFGDGRDTCITYTNSYAGPYTVTHRYNHPGLYEVCVNILYFGGCEARKCKHIQVGRADTCAADFERINTTANPLLNYFRALPQHNNNRKPQKICWRFGDGNDTCINYTETYTGQYVVSHRYAQPGNYEVCVNILYFGGCEARKCRAIQVGRPDTCHADFERIPSSANNPLQAYFKALPQHNNNRKPQKICWRFGDGDDTCITYSETYTGQYVVGHRYAQPGNYEVCVNILYFGGCEARKCRAIQIGRPDTCAADFERILSTANPLLNYFRALPQHNNNRKPQKICWRFGDGDDTCITYPESYTGPYAVSHRYDHAGNYEVCVNILYYGGCEAHKCKMIAVPPPQPGCTVRLFEITPSINSLVRGFLAIPTSNATPPARPERICWYFGDGDDTCIIVSATNPPPYFTMRHTYPAPGVYRACVKVMFAGGCIAQDCREVVIRSASTVCGGYMTDSLIAPRTFKFKGFGIHPPNDQVVSYRWTFGDGTTGFGQEVTHTYAQGGDHNVCLFINTRLGCETRICKTVRTPGSNASQLHLSPNPVINLLNVDFFSTHTEAITIRILNNNGVQVRNYTRTVTVGANNWSHDLSTLLPGLYSYVVQSPNQLASAIFIKQ